MQQVAHLSKERRFFSHTLDCFAESCLLWHEMILTQDFISIKIDFTSICAHAVISIGSFWGALLVARPIHERVVLNWQNVFIAVDLCQKNRLLLFFSLMKKKEISFNATVFIIIIILFWFHRTPCIGNLFHGQDMGTGKTTLLTRKSKDESIEIDYNLLILSQHQPLLHFSGSVLIES